MLKQKTQQNIRFNQLLIFGVFFFTLFSGSIRKWVTANGNINALIVAIQIPILYTFIFIRGLSSSKNNSYSNVFILYVAYLLIAASTPLSPSIYHAVAGFIIHLSFWFGMYIYLVKKDIIKTDRFFYLICALILLETILAIFQSQLPRENVINQYVMEGEFDEEAALSIAMVGESVRVSGTFSYISGFSAFVLFAQFFSFSLFFRKNLKSYVPVISLSVSLILAFLTGSRSTTLINVILTGAFFAFQFKDFDYKQFLKGVLMIILAVAVNISIGDPLHLVNFVSNSYENFDSRFEDNKEEGNGRIWGPFQTIISNDFPNKLIGNGLGISYPAIVAMKGTSKVAETHAVMDDEIGRTLLEGGYLLLIFKIILIVLTIKNLKIDKRFMSIAFSVIFIFMPLTTNVYNIVFFILGIIFLEQAIISKNKTNFQLP